MVLEEGWGGEMDERVVLGWRSVFPVGRYVLPWSGGQWYENTVCILSWGRRSSFLWARSARVAIFIFSLFSVFFMCSSISVGEREKEGERTEDILASTVCFFVVDVAWRLL